MKITPQQFTAVCTRTSRTLDLKQRASKRDARGLFLDNSIKLISEFRQLKPASDACPRWLIPSPGLACRQRSPEERHQLPSEPRGSRAARREGLRSRLCRQRKAKTKVVCPFTPSTIIIDVTPEHADEEQMTPPRYWLSHALLLVLPDSIEYIPYISYSLQ